MSKDDETEILERVSAFAQEGEPDYSPFLPLLASFELPDEQAREFLGIIFKIAWQCVRGGWNDVDMNELIVGMALAAQADADQAVFEPENADLQDGAR